MDLLFYGFCAASGILIMVQNSQPWGIISLHAGAVVAAETLMRSQGASAQGRKASPPASAAPLLLLALLLPTIVHCALALGLHAGLASASPQAASGLPRLSRISLPRLPTPGDHDFSERYLASIEDGARALSRLSTPVSHVFVLDFANPFSAALGLVPPRGDMSWQHWGRNVDAAHFLPPDQLFRNVRIVMEPTWGVNVDPLRHIYGGYIAAHFQVATETEGWRVHVAQSRQPDGPGFVEAQSRAAAGSSDVR
jgi:hypothetical protein